MNEHSDSELLPSDPGHDPDAARPKDPKLHPFRRAILRGLAVLLPPLLTVVIFIWVWNTLREYVLIPVETSVTDVMIWSHFHQQIRDSDPALTGTANEPYVNLSDGRWVPKRVHDQVEESPGSPVMPNTADGVMRRYIEINHLQWWKVGPLFIGGLLIVLSLLGRFLAAGMGRYFWNTFDRLLHQLPIVRNVYGAVKQVTDFFFSEHEIEFNRVVVVEYPRKGIWSIGFVTSESMMDIHGAANEPLLGVFMPTSPMPATGFAVHVKKSETVDLNITIDQAIQFIVSCGVVVPTHQMVKLAPRPKLGDVSSNGGPPASFTGASSTPASPSSTAGGDE